MKKILFALVAMLSWAAFGQTAQIRGRVIDTNNFPLPGATVVLVSNNAAVISDFNGYFTLTSVPQGAQQVKVSYVGFETATQDVVVGQDSSFLTFTLVASVNELNEVVVSGFQAGVNKALNKQRTDVNVSNVVSSDQIGKFPDANIGDALRRVSGISMQNDQGEARDIIIRGFAPELNSVTLNGERIPSAEGDNRRVQMDLIPSDMIQTIEVNKSVTPDMEADAIGGSVNLITRSNPNAFRLSATSAYGLNEIRDGYNGSFSFLVADKLSDKWAYTLSSSLHANDYGSDNVEFVWNDPADWSEASPFDEHDIRRYDVRRTRRSVSLNLDHTIDNNNSLFFKSMYNNRDDWENRFRVRVAKIDPEKNEVRVRRQTKGGDSDNMNRRLEAQSNYKFEFGGAHQLGNATLDWKASTAKADERRPNERYIEFEQKKVDISRIDISNPRYPQIVFDGNEWNDRDKFELSEVTEQNGLTEEKDATFRMDVTLPYNLSDKFKFGFKYKSKEKLRDNDFYDFTSFLEDRYPLLSSVDTQDKTVNGYLAGDKYAHGFLASEEFLGNLTMPANEGELLLAEFISGNYTADEKITAGYAMVTDQLGDKTTMIAGARLEHTNIDYVGYAFEDSDEVLADVEQVTGSGSYTNFLPNLTFQHKVNDGTILNLAFTKTLARPGYFNLVPFKNILIDDEEIEEGNPELEATVSNNIDFTAERYFSSVGLFSVGVFHKNLDNWLYTFTTTDYAYNGANNWTYSQVRNGKSASVTGLEVALQSKLDFLPGFLSNLTFYGNYTYTDSSTDGVEGRDDVPLVGAVKNMANGSIAYETKKFFLRASTNYSGSAIDEVGGDTWEDRYYDEQFFLDVNAAYTVNKNVRLFAEFKNLTNQPLRYYQGIQERTMQLEYYNFNWNAGVKIDF